MTYDLDFFEAWNKMDKLYEDGGSKTDTIEAGIEEALEWYGKNGIPYEDLIHRYKNASSGNLSDRDIGFWYVVGLILANIPSYKNSRGTCNSTSNYLADQNGNIDLSVVYMCNAYLAEKALQAKLGGTWNNLTLHTGAGNDQPDIVGIDKTVELFTHNSSVPIEVEINGSIDVKNTYSEDVLTKARNVNWHTADILAIIDEKNNNTTIIDGGADTPNLRGTLTITSEPEFLERPKSQGPISRGVYKNFSRIFKVTNQNNKSLFNQLRQTLGLLSKRGHLGLNLDIYPEVKANFYSDEGPTVSNKDFPTEIWQKKVNYLYPLVKTLPNINNELWVKLIKLDPENIDWVNTKVAILKELLYNIINNIIDGELILDLNIRGALHNFKSEAEKFYNEYLKKLEP